MNEYLKFNMISSSAIIYSIDKIGRIIPTGVRQVVDDVSLTNIINISAISEDCINLLQQHCSRFNLSKHDDHYTIVRSPDGFLNDSEKHAYRNYITNKPLNNQIITTVLRDQQLNTRIYKIPYGPLLLETILDVDPRTDKNFKRDLILFYDGYAYVDVFTHDNKYVLLRVFDIDRERRDQYNIALFFSYTEQQIFMRELQFMYTYNHKCRCINNNSDSIENNEDGNETKDAENEDVGEYRCILMDHSGLFIAPSGNIVYNNGDFMIRFEVGHYEIVTYDNFIKLYVIL